MDRKQVKRVVLETSLKPFKKMDQDDVEAVCREILTQWYPLIKVAEECAILFWTSDGSEILTWKGDLAEEMEWARYIGFCNAEFRPYTGHTQDPRRQAVLYMDDPPAISYGDLKRIIETFKRIARDAFGWKLTAGATFDPGPEFAHAEFKFKTHPEIMRAGQEADIGRTVSMVRAWSVLEGDSLKYAAYPDGIPDKTPFGAFFWKQCRSFLSELGFDYIWLSNGFGFSHFGWSALGENFDGTAFNKADYGQVSERILDFWRHYKRECAEFPVDVRGTNFSTGIDLASDCVPLVDIYEGGYLRAPAPNYPSGALNYDFGLEMVGYMTRIALLPGDEIPFRYYPNDPWFWQNPWWDLYGREPFDVYCPLSTGRVNAVGQVENPNVIEFLTIDTEKGELDDRCALEVIPHIRRAIDDFPDQAGMLTWLYPLREYHRIAAEHPDRAGLAYFGDWFVRSAINAGLPLNTVLSTDDFPKVLAKNLQALSDTILFTPSTVLEGTYEEDLIRYVEGGGRVLFYGPLDDVSPRIRELLNVAIAGGLTGDFSLRMDLETDPITRWREPRTFRHDTVLSGGTVREVLADEGDDATTVYAELHQEGQARAYALTRRWKDGVAGWIRGSSSSAVSGDPSVGYVRPREYPVDVWNPTELVRYLLQAFGYHFQQVRPRPDTKPALNFVTRKRNGFIFSGFKADTTVVLKYGFPQGAPLLVQTEAEVAGGLATYFLDKSFHRECRAFVRQADGGVLSCMEKPPFPTGMERKLQVSGLADADVTIYPPLERMAEATVELDGKPVDVTDTGGTSGGRTLRGARRLKDRIELQGITGVLSVNW